MTLYFTKQIENLIFIAYLNLLQYIESFHVMYLVFDSIPM